MEITRRTLLGLTGAGAATGLLAGCSGQLPELDTTAAGFGSGGSGTISVWTRSAVQTGMAGVVDAFHRAQDRIRVELTPVLDVQYVTKLATAIRGGAPPDLVDVDDINSSLFIYRDAFTDLTDLVADLDYRPRLSPGHLNLATQGKRVFGLPFLADNSVLWINTDLLERAKVDVDEATRDYDGLLDAVERVAGLGGGVRGWSFPGNGAGALGFTVQPFVWAAKTDMFRGAIGKQTPHVADNPALKRMLTFFRTMWTKEWVTPSSFSDQATAWGAEFLAGKVGIFPSNYFTVVSAAKKGFTDRLAAILIPGPDGGRSFFDGGDNLCIPRGAKNASAAWEFARFALDLPQQQKLPANGYTPVRADANTAGFAKQYPFATPPLKQLDVGFAPKTLGYNLIYNQPGGPFLKMFRQAVFGAGVNAALDTGEAEYARVLKAVQA